MFRPLVCIIWGAFVCLGFCQEEAPAQYKITPLLKNPGIYYEFLGEAKLVRTQWRISIVLDCQRLQDNATWHLQHLERFYEKCIKLLGGECNVLIPIYRFQSEIERIGILRGDILRFFTPIESEDFTVTQMAHSVKKRGAPLEFVGGLSRSLFGTMDAKDRELIGKQINNLYERETNISLLEAEQTHIVRSNLESIHTSLEADKQKISDLSLKMEQFLRLVNISESYEKQSAAANSVNAWVVEFDRTLQSNINCYKTLFNAIETTARGHLHPLLLTHEQLQTLLKQINNRKTGHSLPWEHTAITPEYLFTVSRTSAIVAENRIIISLAFPLTDNIRLLNYRLHSLPVPLKLNNITVYSSIRSAYSNLLVTRDFKEYMLSTPQFFERCLQYNATLMCQPDLPLMEEHDDSPCEFSLLARPSHDILERCNLQFVTDPAPRWKKLKSTDTWLYSTLTPTSLRLICNGEPGALITLNGTGTLAIHGQCVARAKGLTLHGVNTIRTTQTFFYQPEIQLSVELIFPSVYHAPDFPQEQAENELATTLQTWKGSEDEISLRQIEDRFREISWQKQSKTLTEFYIGSGCLANLFIIFGIYVFIRYCYPRCRFTFHKRRQQSENRSQKSHSDIEMTVRPGFSNRPTMPPPPPPLPQENKTILHHGCNSVCFNDARVTEVDETADTNRALGLNTGYFSLLHLTQGRSPGPKSVLAVPCTSLNAPLPPQDVIIA